MIRLNEGDMKKKRVHIIPMAKQVRAILWEIRKMTGYSSHVFPNKIDASRGMSKNVLLNRLRAMVLGPLDVFYPRRVFEMGLLQVFYRYKYRHVIKRTQYHRG